MIKTEWEREVKDYPTEAKYHKSRQSGSEAKFAALNRYTDIVAYDETRVKVKNVEYINANKISDKWSGQKYIATQGTKIEIFKGLLDKNGKLVKIDKKLKIKL